MPASIWKDYEVSFGNVAETDYTIEIPGVGTIFSGHAVRRPGETYLTVVINDVCADYLEHVLPAVTALGCTADPSAVTFSVKDGGGTTVDTVQFVADWSYDYDHSPSALAAPVNGRVSAAQALVASVLTDSDVSVTLGYASSTSTVTAEAGNGDVQTVAVPLASYTGLKYVTVNGVRYTVVDACARYALLYINAFGGWDTLLMEGRESEADAYDRHTMRQRYDNGTRSARGTVEYVNEVTRRWTVRTGWLRDEQAARMHHVIGSPHVFLYDITDGTLQPVVITDTECQYKTYRGNGGQLTNYAITVELAQDMTRR